MFSLQRVRCGAHLARYWVGDEVYRSSNATLFGPPGDTFGGAGFEYPFEWFTGGVAILWSELRIFNPAIAFRDVGCDCVGREGFCVCIDSGPASRFGISMPPIWRPLLECFITLGIVWWLLIVVVTVCCRKAVEWTVVGNECRE